MSADVAAFLARRAELLATATPGTAAAEQLSDLTDGAVSALADTALARLRSPWAVIALGGWGARRLLPRSDLDLLVVTDAPAADLKPALSEVLYPLWDAGLEVGQQVRSSRDHLRTARASLETLTASLTGRRLAGDAGLASRVLAEVAADARKRIRRVRAEIVARERTGSPYLLEPDLKNGAGGQRDLDELTWLGAALSGRPAATPEAAIDAGIIDHTEAALLARAADRITAARWAVDLRVRRPSSLLTLDLAAEIGGDLAGLNDSMAAVHHALLRARARLAGTRTTFDPRGQGAPAPFDGPRLFDLLDRGEDAIADLEEAAWAGLLDDLVPAFSELMSLRRPALSHLYTVGDHSLRAASLVSDRLSERPEAARQRDAAIDRQALQTAALLHDVGKAQRGPGHAERGGAAVATLGRRFGLAPGRVRDAAVLVREHLLLAETASGSDIHDEDVVLQAAGRVKRPELVEALFILTMADSMATGPGAWSPWHAALIGELTDRMRAALSEEVEGAGFAETAEERRAEALAAIGADGGARALADFVRRAPVRYLASTPAATVVAHASLVAAASAAGVPDAFQVGVVPGPADGTWQVSVALADRPGLFALIAGALSLTGLDIMAADAFVAPRGIALDVFVVRPDTRAVVDTATWASFERHLRAALLDPDGLSTRLGERRRHYPVRSRARTSVRTGETGAYATEVSVRAADRVGLLYDIARAIAETGLQIRWARAVTQDGVVRDLFHVTDADGEPVDDPGVLGHLAMRIRERVGVR